MTKRAAIYARVSTDDQAERGYSLPSQIEACQKFASQKGFDVAAVYQDDISGAKAISIRPDGYELQKAIESGHIKTVIVFCVDRLSRDIVDLLTTVRDWLRAGIAIYSLDVGQITSELDIVLVIKGWQGGDERQKIRERTARGRLTKARAGKVVGQGSAPYGYTYAHGELTIIERQAEIVRMIFDWYVNGDESSQTMSLCKIAERLTDMGIPTPFNAKGLTRKNMKATGWSSVVIHQFILSETYAGVWRYGKQSGNEQIAVNVPAIVSREIWKLAQERRAYNSKLAKRRMKREFLLRGLIYCGCGRGMVGGGGRGKNYYYYCARRYGSGVSVGSQICTEPLVKSQAVEHIAWGYIMKLLTNADEFEQALRDAQALEAEQQRPKQKELEHVLSLIADTEYEAAQVAETLKKIKGLVGEKLQAQADEIDRRYQVLQARKKRLETDLEIELSNQTIGDLMQFREAVVIGLNHPTPEERRLWLELLQTKVTVTNGMVIVSCRLSREAVQFDLSTGFQVSSFML